MSDFRLKVFRSVAKNLSFTKASQELFVSQPAITKHIQELEAAYQTRLFDRQGSRISLTESGNLLLEHCERILEDYKRLEYEMHLLHNEYTGGLKLGASTTIAQYVLPPLLASFIGKFPQVSLSLLNGNSREIEAALQEHRIDLGFVEGVFRLPNIRYTTFLEDELVAVVRTGSKLAVGEEITPDELFHLPLVLRERGSGTLDVFERALQQHNIKLSSLQVLMYLGSTESIKLFWSIPIVWALFPFVPLRANCILDSCVSLRLRECLCYAILVLHSLRGKKAVWRKYSCNLPCTITISYST